MQSNELIDEIGKRYGPWLVIRRIEPNYRPEKPVWQDGNADAYIAMQRKFISEIICGRANMHIRVRSVEEVDRFI